MVCPRPAAGPAVIVNPSTHTEDSPMADTRAGAVMFKGSPIGLGGPEIKAGQDAPDFTAVDNLSLIHI